MSGKVTFTRWLLVVLAIGSLVAGDVLARGKGGNSGGGDRGGGGGGGGSSFSGGRSGGSSRSGGGGGGGGGSSAWSGGSSRSGSVSGGQSGGSSRSFSRGNSFSGGSSFSGGGSQSRSRTSGGNAYSGNSFNRSRSSGDGQSFSRNSGGGSSNSGPTSALPRGFNRSGSTFGNVPSGNAPSGSELRRWNSPSGDASARIQSYQAYQALRRGSGESANGNWSEQFRRSNSGGNNDSASGSTPQLRTFGQRQSSGSATPGLSGQSSSRNRTTTGRPDSDQLRAFLNQRRDQSTDGGQVDSTRSRQFSQGPWSTRRNSTDDSAGNDGPTDGSSVHGRGGNQELQQALRTRGRQNGLPGTLPRSDNDQSSFRRNWNRSGDDNRLSGGEGAGREFEGQLRRSNRGIDGENGKYLDFARRGKWSKDSDETNPITRRWFGKSGFGDHRDRSDRHRGDRDRDHGDDFAKHVRKNWHNQWRNHWRDDDHHHGHRRHLPFAYSWWAGYDRSPYHVYWRDDRWRLDPYYWWRPCTAPLLSTWITYDWYEPCYWDYGYGEFVDYRNNYVYVDGQLYGSALDYYAQVRGLAQGVPALSPEQWAGINWLPLGVFAVTRPGATSSQEIIQLAVSPDGIVSGTLFNQQTGTARPLKGMVDQATQRAAWVLADAPGDALVIETSLYNLTEPQCSALAHLGPVTSEVWQLVRLDQPAAAQ